MIEVAFIGGVIRKTFILGVLGSLLFGGLALAGYTSAGLALGTLLGSAVASANLWVVQWVSQRLIRGAEEGRKALGGWTILFVLKMFALFGLVFILLAIFEIHAVGFVIGFSTFLPALGWQSLQAKNPEAES